MRYGCCRKASSSLDTDGFSMVRFEVEVLFGGKKILLYNLLFNGFLSGEVQDRICS